jgi:hypothetical protein
MFSIPEGVIDCQLVAFPDASGFLPDASGSDRVLRVRRERATPAILTGQAARDCPYIFSNMPPHIASPTRVERTRLRRGTTWAQPLQLSVRGAAELLDLVICYS